MDSEDEIGWGDYVQVLMAINITKPLCRGRMVGLGGGTNVLVSLKYEKLSNFCYRCEFDTHSDKNCSVWLQSKGFLNPDHQQYGAWLRTPTGGYHRKKTMTVDGSSFHPQRSEWLPEKRATHPTPMVAPSGA